MAALLKFLAVLDNELAEVQEDLDGYTDADYDEGIWVPNRAMSAHMRLIEVRSDIQILTQKLRKA